MLKTFLLVFLRSEVPELMGLEVKMERLPGLMKMRNFAELISVATRKDWEAFEVVDLARASGGAWFGLYL